MRVVEGLCVWRDGHPVLCMSTCWERRFLSGVKPAYSTRTAAASALVHTASSSPPFAPALLAGQAIPIHRPDNSYTQKSNLFFTFFNLINLIQPSLQASSEDDTPERAGVWLYSGTPTKRRRDVAGRGSK